MYKWPTWADYMYAGGIATEYQNWALPGGSNDFIFHSFMECDIANKINKDDYVAIMWSQQHRLSNYSHQDGWELLGNAYLHQPKDRMMYYSPDKTEIELESYSHSIQEILSKRRIHNIMMSIEPLGMHTSMAEYLGYESSHDNWKETLPGDHHPSPREHADFIKDQHISLLLDTARIDKLCKASEEYIWNSSHPHRQIITVFPEKYPQRKGKDNVGRVQPFNWE